MSSPLGRRHRFFDVAVEDPDLLKADSRARRRGQVGRGANASGERKLSRRRWPVPGTHRRGGGPEGKEAARRRWPARGMRDGNDAADRRRSAVRDAAEREKPARRGGAEREGLNRGDGADRGRSAVRGAVERGKPASRGAAGHEPVARRRGVRVEKQESVLPTRRRRYGASDQNASGASELLGVRRSARGRKQARSGAGSPKGPDASGSTVGSTSRARRRQEPAEAASRGPHRPAVRGRGMRGVAAEPGVRLPSPMIDPRIAARRAGVEAEAAAGSRSRRRVAAATVALVVLVGAGALMMLSPLVSVRTIEVRGAARTGPEVVRAASGLSSGTPLLRLDEQRVTARVAALPWVRSARLERRWPSTVVLSIEERQPAVVAPCLAGAASCLVDPSGRVLASATDDPKAAASLPRLVGVPMAGEPGATLSEAARGPLAVALALPAALRPLVQGVRSDGAEVALDLQAPGRGASPPVVRLGAPERIADKLTAAATVLARTSVNGVAVLDVRVPESPAMTRVKR